jgi:hypothetical protein
MAKPAAPTNLVITNVTFNSLNLRFSWVDYLYADKIDSMQIGYGTNPTTVQTIIGSDGDTPIYPLNAGTTYYFWARTHNSSGFSNWSARAQATTPRVPDPPSTPWLTDIQPTSVTVDWNPNWDGGNAIIEYQLGYGLDPNNPTNFVNQWPPTTIYGLTPGGLYYFWGRARNSAGWSGWSGRAGNRTTAGARVKDGDVWRQAIPYVKDGGVWRLAQPWTRESGTWRRTS